MLVPTYSSIQKRSDELEKFTPLVIKELYRLFKSTDTVDVILERTKQNKLLPLSRAELLEILRTLNQDFFIFDIKKRNFPQRKLKDERLKQFGFLADSDFITIYPREKEPIYLRLFPEFKNWCDARLNNTTLYTLTYNEMTGEILINNKVFRKTQLDSDVDCVFKYLAKNPNRIISIEEIKKGSEKEIKNLPKIIERAGFTGNFLRTFFRVSKSSIYFRHQLTRGDFMKLNIPRLSL